MWDLVGDQEQARCPVDGDVLAVAFGTAATVAGDIAGQTRARPLNHLQQHLLKDIIPPTAKGNSPQSNGHFAPWARKGVAVVGGDDWTT